MNASSTPIGSSAGATIRRQIASASMQSAAPMRGARREQHARVGTDDAARDVRNDQPDETDESGEDDAAGGQQRRGRQNRPLRAIDVDADRARAPLADAQRVERRRPRRCASSVPSDDVRRGRRRGRASRGPPSSRRATRRSALA